MRPKEFKTVIWGRVLPIVLSLLLFYLTIDLVIAGKMFHNRALLFHDVIILVLVFGFTSLFVFMFITFSKTLFITTEGIGEKSIAGKEVIFIKWNEVKELDTRTGKTLYDNIIPALFIRGVKRPSGRVELCVVLSKFTNQAQKEIMEELKKYIPKEKFVKKS